MDEGDKERARDLSELLYETALLTSGFSLASPRDYASKVFTLMKIALGYDLSAEAQEAPAAAGSSSSVSSGSSESNSGEPKLETVEAEVMSEGDPWSKGRKGGVS